MGRIHVDPRYMPLVKLLKSVQPHDRIGDTFFDWLHLVACALHSIELGWRPDKTAFLENEADYLSVARKYKAEQLNKFAEAKAMLVDLLNPMADVLGELFSALELHNKWRGQYFTPWPLCKLMATMSVGDESAAIQQNGFLTAYEPACGSGAMMIALADHLLEAGFNPQTQLHIQANDIDHRCFHMTYVQLSLLGLPATVHLGNALDDEPPSRSWHTPFHCMNLWDVKLRRHYRELAARMNIPPEVQERWERAGPAERMDLVTRAGEDTSAVIGGLVPLGVIELLDDGGADRPIPPMVFPGFDLILANPPFGRG